MTIILEKFNQAKEVFNKEREKEESSKIMIKIIATVNELGTNFSKMDGGSLANIQIKLAGWKFFLSSEIAELNLMSESLKLEIKEIKASRWNEVAETIKAEKGKVSNRQEIENVLIMETRQLANQQILYETRYYTYKLRMSALDDILTSICQRIAELKREIELSKTI